MKVKLLKCGEVKEFNDSYAARLIEQGKAILPPKEEKKTQAKKTAQAEEKADGKSQKG